MPLSTVDPVTYPKSVSSILGEGRELSEEKLIGDDW